MSCRFKCRMNQDKLSTDRLNDQPAESKSDEPSERRLCIRKSDWNVFWAWASWRWALENTWQARAGADEERRRSSWGCLGKAKGGQFFDSCDQPASQQHLETSLNQLSECSVRPSPSLQCNKSSAITLQGRSDGSELPAERGKLPSAVTLTAHFSNFLERVHLYGSQHVHDRSPTIPYHPLSKPDAVWQVSSDKNIYRNVLHNQFYLEG